MRPHLLIFSCLFSHAQLFPEAGVESNIRHNSQIPSSVTVLQFLLQHLRLHFYICGKTWGRTRVQCIANDFLFLFALLLICCKKPQRVKRQCKIHNNLMWNQGPGKCKKKQKQMCDEKFNLNRNSTTHSQGSPECRSINISMEYVSKEGKELWEIKLIGVTLKNWFSKVQRESSVISIGFQKNLRK